MIPSLAMLFSRRRPQLLGAVGALLFGGQAVRAITLDLGDAGRNLSSTKWSDPAPPPARALDDQMADSDRIRYRFNQGSSSYNSIRHDELL